MLESLGLSTVAVVLAEMGDKTQLLALLLAVKFQRPWPIVWGILVATLFNHGLAGAAGAWIAESVPKELLTWILAGGFLAMAVWILIPDKEEGGLLSHPWIARFGVFGTTVITFFLAEMGDKTQIATVGLAAHYGMPLVVIAGTTLGMLLADVPAVWLGSALTKKIPMKPLRIVCALVFAALGVSSLLMAY